MKSVIVGTAGHIDHGKTALVKALTGIDADRLQEEKRRGITILTKADAVDSDMRDVVRLEVEEFLRGSFLDPAHSPIVSVSSLTGSGLVQLKAALVHVASQVQARDSAAFARLPIDRVFTMK